MPSAVAAMNVLSGMRLKPATAFTAQKGNTGVSLRKSRRLKAFSAKPFDSFCTNGPDFSASAAPKDVLTISKTMAAPTTAATMVAGALSAQPNRKPPARLITPAPGMERATTAT